VKKRTLFNLLKYALAFGLLGWVVWKNWEPEGGHGLHEVWQRHFEQGEPVHWGFFAVAVGIYLSALLISFVRWFVLVRAVDLPFKPVDGVRLGAVGFFFNTFLPGSVGGDIVKAAFLAHEHPGRRTKAVATVLIDRAIALWALIWFVAILGGVFWLSGMLEGDAKQQCESIVTIAGIIVVVTLLVWTLLGFLPPHRAERFAGRLLNLPKVGVAAAEFWRAVWMYRCRQKSVALAMLLSWTGHVGFVLAFYCCANTLWDGVEPIPTLTQHFLIVPIGLVIQAIPLFPGGVGVGELGFGGLYGLLNASKSLGVLGSLVQRVVCWMLGLLCGLVYLGMRSQLQADVRETGGDFPGATSHSPLGPGTSQRETSAATK
jgi:uncharacterized protein (TIRG00374 family)